MMKSAKGKRRPDERNRKTPLSELTRRRIFALMRERGLDDDARHNIQRSIIGKQSLRDFTEADGQELLSYLLGHLKPAILDSELRLRKRWTRPDGVIEIRVVPTITDPQIRKAFALIHQVYELEHEEQARGLPEEHEEWTEDPRARLDGWARKISDNEALQLSELMKEEASNLIEILKDRIELLKKRTAHQ